MGARLQFNFYGLFSSIPDYREFQSLTHFGAQRNIFQQVIKGKDFLSIHGFYQVSPNRYKQSVDFDFTVCSSQSSLCGRSLWNHFCNIGTPQLT
jgi:hypothetical protein